MFDEHELGRIGVLVQFDMLTVRMFSLCICRKKILVATL
jgi:hypothetical protein